MIWVNGDIVELIHFKEILVASLALILIPNKIEAYEFVIEEMWDNETDEKVDHVNPGRAGQCVKMKLPIKCERGWIIRRKKW